MSETQLAGWWGIVNAAGQLSQVAPSQGMAGQVLGTRGDHAECRLVPLKILVDLEPPKPEPPAKKGLFGRKKK